MLTSALLLLLCIGVGIVIYLLLKRQAPPQDATMLEWLKSTQLEMRSLQQSLTESSSKTSLDLATSMQQQTRDIHERLSKASEVIGELKREAGAFSEVSRSMKELHEFLKSPKLRGNIGEQVLNDLVSQMFPKQKLFIQHRFKTGSIVDVAIQTDAGILPIDSKFPMEHFQIMMQGETASERETAKKAFERDVRKHIDDIAGKYILPNEGTMDFALMYVPSESVYYEIASSSSLLEYARESRVYPVSPTTLYAHLQTILLSFEGQKVESKAKEVFALLRGIEKEYSKVDAHLTTLGKHLLNAQNTFGSVSSSFSALGRSVERTKELDGPSGS